MFTNRTRQSKDMFASVLSSTKNMFTYQTIKSYDLPCGAIDTEFYEKILDVLDENHYKKFLVEHVAKAHYNLFNNEDVLELVADVKVRFDIVVYFKRYPDDIEIDLTKLEEIRTEIYGGGGGGG